MSSPCLACSDASSVRHPVAAEVSLAEEVDYDQIELVNLHWTTFSDGWPLPFDEEDHCAAIFTRGVSSHQ